MTGYSPSSTPNVIGETTNASTDVYVFPLSYSQKRLWFVQQLMPESPGYNVPFNARIVGELDVIALSATMREIVRRHESLRTSFPMREGQPVQEIHPPCEIEIPCVDLSALKQKEKEEVTRHLRQEERDRWFDLEKGPMLRQKLVRLGPQECELQLVMHHIITDGWSAGILLGEIQALYEAYRSGSSSPLIDLPIQYADYALWQRDWLQGEVSETQMQYWRRQLADLPVLDMPNDYKRSQSPIHPGEYLAVEFDRELTERLRTLSQRESVTLFMVLLAGLKSLLSKYARQKDIAVGVSVANRTVKETEPVIGLFVNTLIMRTSLEGQPTFRDLLQRVRSVALEAYAHQDVPFEKLVEELNPERTVGEVPLIQVLLVFQNMPDRTPEISGLQITTIHSDAKYSNLDLCVAITEESDRLTVELSYSSDLFSRSSMQRFAIHYQRLLESVVADPDQLLDEISLLTTEERVRLVGKWNKEEAASVRHTLIHELFEQQVDRTPDALAIVCGEEELTYRELDERANQLGHYLRTVGVRPEVKVALCLEPSLDMIVGILGVVKAGGVYVPLDPLNPVERLSYLWDNSEAKILLTQTSLEAKFGDVAALCLDRDWQTIAQQDKSRLQSIVLAENLINTIYTSGSTGTPKPIGVTQSALAERAKTLGDEYQLQRSDRLLQFLSFGFDAFGEELFPTIVTGGTLVIHRGVKSLPPGAMLALLERARITVVHAPFACWGELEREASRIGSSIPRSVRLLITGGEAIPREDAQRWVANSESRLANAYGPTEATITSTIYMLSGPEGRDRRNPVNGVTSLFIGKPILNTRVYVLDDAQQAVSTGLVGELHIAGAGLARGYLNQPALTAERFTPDPFGPPGTRMYRTGDVVRWHSTGNLEYLGRTDQQVKIRGFRVELGEIEAALRLFPEVRRCAVAIREDAIRGKYLAAYVVGKSDGRLRLDDLRCKLRQQLPDHMVPTAFVEITELPLTINGKVDRRALPEPQFGNREAHVPPRTPLEEIVSGIWMDVLGLERVSIHDNFFNLGGHSMLATQVVSRLQRSLTMSIPFVAIFESPTIAQLAENIQKLEGALTPPPIKRRSQGAPIPLSFSQERLWFADQLAPGSPAYNGPLVLRLRGELRVDLLGAVFDEIVRRHEVLRTSFPTLHGRPHQLISPAAKGVLKQIDLTTTPDHRRENRLSELLDTEVQMPFELALHHPLRATLYTMAQDDHVLCAVIHHIAFDAWSMSILVRELAATYVALVNGTAPPFPELPLQYSDVAVWEHEWLQGNVLERHVNYWQARLLNAQIPEMPADFSRPALRSFQAGIHKFRLSAERSQALRQLGRHQGATDFMVLLAIINIWLCYYTGQQDIVVGTPISNRSQLETEALIGFFINTLVCRNFVNRDVSFVDLLDEIAKQTLRDYAHQGLPFERLVHELRVKHDPHRNPLFQLMFNMENLQDLGFGEDAQRMEMEIPGLETEQLGSGPVQCRFDLHLNARVAGDSLEFACTYSSELYRPATIESWLATFSEIAKVVAEAPETQISGILSRIAEFEQKATQAQRHARNQLHLQGLHNIQRRTVAVDSHSEAL
jgi:amino acid adenylation domain-containing protein